MVLNMISCKDYTLLIEKSKEQKLTFFQRLQIKLHAKLCKVCDNYAVDSAFLDKLIKKLHVDPKPLDEGEKESMKKAIEEKLG
jgi:hypothetical protein